MMPEPDPIGNDVLREQGALACTHILPDLGTSLVCSLPEGHAGPCAINYLGKFVISWWKLEGE